MSGLRKKKYISPIPMDCIVKNCSDFLKRSSKENGDTKKGRSGKKAFIHATKAKAKLYACSSPIFFGTCQTILFKKSISNNSFQNYSFQTIRFKTIHFKQFVSKQFISNNYFRTIHFKQFISDNSFQTIHFKQFISNNSFQTLHFKQFISNNSFQTIRVNQLTCKQFI
jgi:hypothetical protein